MYKVWGKAAHLYPYYQQSLSNDRPAISEIHILHASGFQVADRQYLFLIYLAFQRHNLTRLVEMDCNWC